MNFIKIAESHKFTANAEDWKLFLKIPRENKAQDFDIEKHIKKMKSKTYNRAPIVIEETLLKRLSEIMTR